MSFIKKFENFEEEKENDICQKCGEESCKCSGKDSEDDDNEETNESKSKWIKDAIKKPGSLRKSLGKKEGEKISKSEID